MPPKDFPPFTTVQHYFHRRRDRPIYLSEALVKQAIGIARTDDGNWRVCFRGFDLTTINDRSNTLSCIPLAQSPQP